MGKVRAHIRVFTDGRLEAVERRPVWLTYDGRRVARYRGKWRVITDDNRLNLDSAESIVDKEEIDFSEPAPRRVERDSGVAPPDVSSADASNPSSGTAAQRSESANQKHRRVEEPKPADGGPSPEDFAHRFEGLLRSLGVTQLADLGLSQAVSRALTRAGISSPLDILQTGRAEIMKIERVGEAGMREILEGFGSVLWRAVEIENIREQHSESGEAARTKVPAESMGSEGPSSQAEQRADEVETRDADDVVVASNDVIDIPVALRNTNLEHVSIPIRPCNTLLRASFETLGDLHGLSKQELREIDGIGDKSIAELFAALGKLEAQWTREGSLHEGHPDDVGATLETAGLLIVPESHRKLRLSDLQLTKRLKQRLDDLGLRSLGDLAEYDANLVLMSLGAPLLMELRSTTQAVVEIPMDELTTRRVDDSGGEKEERIPNLSSEVLEKLASAETPEDEILALVADLDERNAGFFLSRLPFGTVEQPILESIAESHDLSRERVRQIVSKREKYLRESGVRLPINSRLVELLEKAGGIHGTHGYLRLLKHAGYEGVRAETIAALPGLAELGLVPRIEYKPKYRLWLSESGIEEWWNTEGFKKFRRDIRKKARAGFRRISAAILDELVSDSPIETDDIPAIVTPRGTRLRKQLGHLIPVPAPDSVLTRLVDKTLAVCEEISLTSLRSGLRRWHRLGEVPPKDVLRAILESHPDFTVETEVVRWTQSKSDEEVLADSELEAMRLFEEADGIVLLWDFVDAMEAAGFSAPTAQLALRRPYIRHPSTAIYALRARDIPSSAVRRMERKRNESRSVSVVSAKWNGPDRFEVHYSLSRYNLQGILGVPPGLKTQRESWRGRFPSGSGKDLTMRNGFLWNLKSWFDKKEAAAGDHVFATFMPAQATIEFELIED